jgi:hypothetical protein
VGYTCRDNFLPLPACSRTFELKKWAKHVPFRQHWKGMDVGSRVAGLKLYFCLLGPHPPSQAAAVLDKMRSKKLPGCDLQNQEVEMGAWHVELGRSTGFSKSHPYMLNASKGMNAT